MAPSLAAIGPVLIGDLERHLDRGRAVVGEEHAGEIAGEELRQRRGEIDRRLMGEACKHHMLESGGLLGERLVERGVRMAVGARPP
jgi:hypothetical protein